MIAVHIRPSQRRLAPWSALTVLALVAALLGAQAPPSARAAEPTPIPSTVTLVGSLQSELGCAADWDPACAATELASARRRAVYAADFDVPAGSYEFKVALNAPGTRTTAPAACRTAEHPARARRARRRSRFSYDDTTHRRRASTPTDLAAAAVTAADRALAADVLRRPLTREQFYFVMTDRFANGDTAQRRRRPHRRPARRPGFDPTDKGFYHGGDLDGPASASSTTSRASARPRSG